jgi:hypothetical protein
MNGKQPQADVLILPKSLAAEVALVFIAQIVVVVGLVWLDKFFSLRGNLHALVGLVFLILPIFVLDRRGRPYSRYGVALGKPLGDFAFVLLAMAVAFPPIVFFAPSFWGIGGSAWRFAWPAGYPAVALTHLIVVALPEEFFYRAYLMGRLDDIFHGRIRLLGAEVGWSLPVQAALFAIGHYVVDLNPNRLGVFFPALAFGWLRAKRGTIVSPVLFHAASNIFMEIFRAGYGL